jgi:hypothetical protein
VQARTGGRRAVAGDGGQVPVALGDQGREQFGVHGGSSIESRYISLLTGY